MRVLFIGGTGIISSGCVQKALERGWSVTLLNRGLRAPAPPGCRHIQADIRQPETVRAALNGNEFDAVVDWVAFEPAHVETDLDLFRNRTGQLLFISSASIYQTPPRTLPVTEDTPLDNPFWAYSQQKIACEDRLRAAMADGFPATIVRPSHTYGRGPFPYDGGCTVLRRIRDGRPIVVPGDGTSLWTLTHNLDFATGLLGLLGNPRALGEAVHVTGDEWLSWNRIFEILGEHLGRAPELVHVPSAAIRRIDAEWGASVWGDKAHSMLFDNSKLRGLVSDFRCAIPFAEGAGDIVSWYDEDPARWHVDSRFDALQDVLIRTYRHALESLPG